MKIHLNNHKLAGCDEDDNTKIYSSVILDMISSMFCCTNSDFMNLLPTLGVCKKDIKILIKK